MAFSLNLIHTLRRQESSIMFSLAFCFCCSQKLQNCNCQIHFYWKNHTQLQLKKLMYLQIVLKTYTLYYCSQFQSQFRNMGFKLCYIIMMHTSLYIYIFFKLECLQLAQQQIKFMEVSTHIIHNVRWHSKSRERAREIQKYISTVLSASF